MALTAKFTADFDSFYAAVQKAQVSLKSFETGAGSVEKTLTRMGNSFSGVKIIQEAHLMSAAMVKAGGIAALTDKELRKLGATVDEASQKMRKLGLEVPPGFQKISDAAKATQQPTLSLASGFGLLAGAVTGFIALNVVRWFTESTKAALAYGDQLSLLHAKTDLSFRDLQILEDVGIGSGVAIDALANGVQVLQMRLGDGSAKKGIEALALSFDRIKQLSPGEQFATIGAEIAKIKDPTERATVAAEVFGRTWKELIPALRANMAESAASAKIVGDKQIEATDRAGDRWTKFWNDQKRGWTAWLGNVIIATEDAKKRFDEVNRRAAALNGSNIPDLPTAPAKRIGLGAFVNDVDPELGAKGLDEMTAAVERRIKALNDLAKITREDAAGSEFAWQRSLALTKMQLDHVLVLESRLLSNRAALPFASPNLVNVQGARDFSGEGFEPAPIEGQSWDEATGKVEKLNSALSGVDEVLSGIQTKWAQSAVVATRAIDAISTRLAEGDWVGAIVAAGAAVGNFVVGLFKASEETSKVSPLRDVFFKAAGGLEHLNPLILELTGNLDSVQELLDARTVDQWTAAWTRLQAILDTQTLGQDADAFARRQSTIDSALQQYAATVTKVDDVVKKYGFTSEETGHQLEQMHTNLDAAGLASDLEVLENAGLSNDTILNRMAKSFNALVQNALKSGAALPESLKPYLERMIELGLLTDATGKKIENLDDITFGKTLPSSLDALTAALDHLADVIRGFPSGIPTPTGSSSRPPADNTVTAHSGGFFGFSGFKRMHSGGKLEPYEIPFIGKVGEGVVNTRGMGMIGQAGLHAINSGILPMPKAQPLPSSVTREWNQPAASGPVIHIDARGAMFDAMSATTLSKKIRTQIAQGGTEQTAWRGSIGRTNTRADPRGRRGR